MESMKTVCQPRHNADKRFSPRNTSKSRWLFQMGARPFFFVRCSFVKNIQFLIIFNLTDRRNPLPLGSGMNAMQKVDQIYQ
jgi:hypothetical protein